ncbi:hypothetical protein C8R44DRAFT_727888 [Mycena epipterygia]|nr:hypothetical protein C8R44DRAFT_727888 [Mycena epipterygia]
MASASRTRHDTRKYHLRRSPTDRRLPRQSTPEHPPRRPVLVPLHTNLRRRPLRSSEEEKRQDDPMPPIQLGSKRKRVASSNENAHAGGRPTRGSGRLKRLRSDAYGPPDSGEASGMDIDDTPLSTRWSASGSDDESDAPLSELSEDDDDDQAESTDDHLINVASAKELQRLRKDHLVRLYISAGLSDEADTLTKSEIIDSIVAAREDVADLPPSSPRGVSSDEQENDADEDDVHTPIPAVRTRYTNGLRRRATVNEMDRSRSRPSKGRSLSMGHLLAAATIDVDPSTVASGSNLNGTSVSSPARRRKPSRLATAPSFRTSFPPLQPPTHAVSSPPATRLRSRKASAISFSLSAPLSSASASSPAMYANGFPFPVATTTQRGTAAAAKGRAKGKAKQVEFIGDLAVRERERERERRALAEESDLTELETEEDEAGGATPIGDPSPRRLRSKDKERERLNGLGSVNGKGKENVAVKMVLDSRRVTPMRRAKMACAAPEDEEEEEEVEAQVEESEPEEEDQLDQLATPPRNRHPRWSQKQRQLSPLEEQRTPLARRLRPRTRGSGSVEPSPSEAEADGDGDDEQEDEDEDEDEEATVDGEEDAGAEEEDDEEDEEQTIAVEPRKLRNGKIVGDEMEIVEEDEEVDEVDEEAEEEDVDVDVDIEEDTEESADVEPDAEAETDEDPEAEAEDQEEDEPMEDDDVDLTIATAKTLVRLRRDDLVRLCETRDLEAVGTKPQLAEALLQWRDLHADASSPSSVGTVTNRPPSTVVKRRRNHSQPDTPVLLRSHRVHIDEPITPEPKEAPVGEPELELDLESLGLDDREIPPDKLQKLEKIGSGGFKDVFIGKFRGRRIAISEFRGQLSAMDIKELKLLGGFDHPNIVRFLGVSIPENTRETPVMIVSELCSNGDLFDYVRNVSAPSLNKVLTMMLDIARGLEYLHLRKPSVIHRDCKSSNILITAKGTAKIADFGLAKVKQSTRSMVRSLVGTVNWQAPELWHAHPKYNHKVDVFSCAMVYWEILQWHAKEKKFPWEGMNEHAIYDIVGSKKQRPSTNLLRKQWSGAIVDLIERMWAHEHQDRPTMSEVVEALEEMRK